MCTYVCMCVCIYVCMCSICLRSVRVNTSRHKHVEPELEEMGCIFFKSLTYCSLGKASWQVNTWDLPFSTPKCYRYIQPRPDFCVGAGGLNSGPRAHQADGLTH